MGDFSVELLLLQRIQLNVKLLFQVLVCEHTPIVSTLENVAWQLLASHLDSNVLVVSEGFLDRKLLWRANLNWVSVPPQELSLQGSQYSISPNLRTLSKQLIRRKLMYCQPVRSETCIYYLKSMQT